MSLPTLYNFAHSDGRHIDVRVVEREGDPWWVLTDVCSVLDIANSRDAATRLDPDEKTTVAITDSAENCHFQGPGTLPTIINESGLWSLVLTSRRPEAKRFKKWLTSEVIPSIRKTGGYIAANGNETPEELVERALTVARDTIERQKAALSTAQVELSEARAELSHLTVGEYIALSHKSHRRGYNSLLGLKCREIMLEMKLPLVKRTVVFHDDYTGKEHPNEVGEYPVEVLEEAERRMAA